MSLPVNRWHLKQNGVLSQNKQDAENDVHLSTSFQGIVSNDFKNVSDDGLYQTCPNFPGSMTTSGLLNG